MPFKTALILRSVGDSWVVEAPLVYFDKKESFAITVPIGYKTDLASVPRIAWRIVRPDHPTARRAAVVHDYIYTDLTDMFTKKQADEIFYQALLEEGTSKFLAYMMYLSVRVGGKGNWK